MKREEFKQFLNGSIRYLDGATGSNLMKAGMPMGVCPEKWILDNRDEALRLQKAYVAAGTDILYCPTFTAKRIKLKEYGLDEHMEQMIQELVGISKEAAASAERPVYIAGDLTMTGKQLVPIGDMELDELIDVYKEQIMYLDKAGVDLLIVETMMSLQEARAALIAAKEVTELPVMVTMTFEKEGRTLFGTDALTAAIVLEKLGAAAIGANCSTGPAHMQKLIEMIAKNVSIPVIAKPNAGLPVTDKNGNTAYDKGPEAFAGEMKLLVLAGATVLGGCCGTTPEHIRLLKEYTNGLKAPQKVETPYEALASERLTLQFGKDQIPRFMEEVVSFEKQAEITEEIEEGFYDTLTETAEELEESGADMIYINMDCFREATKKLLVEAMQEIAGVTRLPLCIGSGDQDVLDEALKQYPGRLLVYGYGKDADSCQALEKVALRYGAFFINREGTVDEPNIIRGVKIS